MFFLIRFITSLYLEQYSFHEISLFVSYSNFVNLLLLLFSILVASMLRTPSSDAIAKIKPGKPSNFHGPPKIFITSVYQAV